MGTITLSASNATYNGTEKAASTSGKIKGFTTPDIVYEKQVDGGSYETIDSTPKDAGTYRASITYNVNEEAGKVYIEDGTQVTLKNNVLTYGEALAALEFNEAVFMDENGNPVTGS